MQEFSVSFKEAAIEILTGPAGRRLATYSYTSIALEPPQICVVSLRQV